jgi:hypothetical protein
VSINDNVSGGPITATKFPRKLIAPLALPDAFAQVGGDPFGQGNSLNREHFHTMSPVRTSCPENISFHERSGM